MVGSCWGGGIPPGPSLLLVGWRGGVFVVVLRGVLAGWVVWWAGGVPPGWPRWGSAGWVGFGCLGVWWCGVPGAGWLRSNVCSDGGWRGGGRPDRGVWRLVECLVV